MSEPGSGTGKAVVREGDPTQSEMFAEMAAIERERIASRNKMTEAMTAGFAHMGEADKRQFEFRKDKLERDDAYRNKRLSHFVRFGWGGFTLVAILLIAFTSMILWGSPDQRQAAFTSIGYVGAFALGALSMRIAGRGS